jgi:hypothetical protein
MEIKTAYNWKARKPIICEDNERLRFMKNYSQGRGCSFCGDEIGMNEGVLTLDYHCWIHLGCLDEFCATIKKFKKDKAKELILERL